MKKNKIIVEKAKDDVVATIKNLAEKDLPVCPFDIRGGDPRKAETRLVSAFSLSRKDKGQNLSVEFSEDLENNFFSWNQNIIHKNNDESLSALVCNFEKDFLFDQISNLEIIKNIRASADMASCYLMFHDFALHQQQNFSNNEQRIFDEFEKIRLLAKASQSYVGIAKNITEKIENDISFADENSLSLLLVGEIFSHEILQKKFPKIAKLLGDLKKKLDSKILQKIKQISEQINNQKDFASLVCELLELLKKPSEDASKNSSKQDQELPKNPDDLVNNGAENIEKKEQQNLEGEEEKISEEITEKKIEQIDFAQEKLKDELSFKLEKSSNEEDKIEFKNSYKIFSSKFDEVIFPQKLLSKNELQILRDQLDLKLIKLSGISKRMTLKLKRKLLSKRNTFLEFEASRGIINRKKISRIVLDPMIEDIWINNKTHEYHNTALTILLDNSGSMRGNPIIMSAMACEIIAEILEKFSIKTEIIGFTTADWKGGRVRKLWENSGQPKNPGRLNELRHIVYKHFNQSFKKSKINLGLMLKEGILKENIDGEALLFARARLVSQSEKRKILVVISDGTPVDDSTSSSNDSDILSEHLKHVVSKIEKQSSIEIIGIGIGHSTDDFYRNSIAIKTLEELGDVMIEKIIAVL